MNLKNVSEEELRRELELRGYYTQNLWCIDDVFRHHECEVDDAQEILDKVMNCESVCEHIFESIDYYAEKVLKQYSNQIGDVLPSITLCAKLKTMLPSVYLK